MRKFMNTLLAGGLALTILAGGSVQAAPNTFVEVTGGGQLFVSIDEVNFGQVPYNFNNQTDTANVVLNVDDNTGTGAGWNVTLGGTDFTRTLPSAASFNINNLTLVGGSVATDAGQTGSGVVASPVNVTGTAAKILSAAPLQGMGNYTVTFANSTLVIPGGTLVGQYQSTLTVSIISGP